MGARNHYALNPRYLRTGASGPKRATERELLTHVREFLLELGAGFAFIGNQVKVTVGDSDYSLDRWKRDMAGQISWAMHEGNARVD